jgi:hypothetical protein
VDEAITVLNGGRMSGRPMIVSPARPEQPRLPVDQLLGDLGRRRPFNGSQRRSGEQKMKNALKVRIVESIADQVNIMEEKVRARAYENFLMRGDASSGELNDWLSAEREVLISIHPIVSEEVDGIIAVVALPDINVKDLSIQATNQDILISTSSARPVFGVIHMPHVIDPNTLQAKYIDGAVQLLAPTAGGAAFKKSA